MIHIVYWTNLQNSFKSNARWWLKAQHWFQRYHNKHTLTNASSHIDSLHILAQGEKKKLILTLLSSLSFNDIFVVLQPNNSLLNKLPSYSRNVRYKLRKNSACLFCTFSLLGEFQCITWKLRQYTYFFTCFHCQSWEDGKHKKPAQNYGGGLLISMFWSHCFALLLCSK